MIDRNHSRYRRRACTPMSTASCRTIAASPSRAGSQPIHDDHARVGAWRAQARSIRSRYGAVAAEPVPARLALDRLLASERGWRSWRGFAAAAVDRIADWRRRRLACTARICRQHGGRSSAPSKPAKDGFAAFTSEAIEAYKLYVVEVRHPVEVAATGCGSSGAMAVETRRLQAARA